VEYAAGGFQQLYDRLPGPKPLFEEVWRWTGGNPRMLGRLYESGWDVVGVVLRVAEEKRLTAEFVSRWRSWLELAVEDPDVISKVEFPHELRQVLVWRNLIIYIYRRRPRSLGRPAASREGLGARHRQKRSVADADTQRGGENGVEGGGALAAAASARGSVP